ncbi:MAG: UDP-N-acetylmuramate dehydrogenase [Bdellovibrionales bacterium]
MKNIRGEFIENAPIGTQSWFGCGGTADLLFKPADEADLQLFFKPPPPWGGGLGWGGAPVTRHPTPKTQYPTPKTQHPSPITIIGGLANTIIRDGGLRGVTIRLGKAFSQIEVMDDHTIRAGCGALNGNVAAAAVKAGIGGFEFLSGIPGSLGGALRMNAGAYGAEIKDILVEIHALDLAGNRYRLIPSMSSRPSAHSARVEGSDHLKRSLDYESDAFFARDDNGGFEALEINLSYRNNDAPHYLIFTGAILKGVKEDYDTVKSRITDIKSKRNATQPIKEKTGGSTFANPHPEELRKAGLPEDTRAWQIVEKVGGRGLSIGGAKMSEKHCNFMINTGNATASDLENLGDEIRARALNDLGLDLHWEIKRIGEKP